MTTPEQLPEQASGQVPQQVSEGIPPARSGWSRLLPLVAILIATVALAALVRGFVETVIVEPILYVGWIVSLLLRSIPEALFWFLFVLLALIMATRSLQLRSSRRRRRTKDADVYGPVGRRARLLHHASTQSYSRWRLAGELGTLAGELAWPGRRVNPERQRAWLSAAGSGIPPEVAAYFLAGLDPYRPEHSPWYRRGLRPELSPLDLDPDVVVAFLEELEMRGGGT